MACYHTADVTCPECNKDYYKGVTTSTGTVTLPVMHQCNHCYCGETIRNNRPHGVCCKCGDAMAAPVVADTFGSYLDALAKRLKDAPK